MNTTVIHVDSTNPDAEAIRRAAEVIRAGGLVAFPTETVYGLGANALDAAAVQRIYAAKGRPATNPVIVHVAAATDVRNVAEAWPESAQRLTAHFWPGPLTLVVSKRPQVPDIVTAGGPTVAVRCPNHLVARALIQAAGVPIAAPSANRSTELSPTRAEHVLTGLDGRIPLVLDGGPCPGGIESTVVDVTGNVPRVLRPGLITVPMLEAVVGRVDTARRGYQSPESVLRSPGQMEKHYSPKTPLRLIEEIDQSIDGGGQVGVLSFRGFRPDAAASQLYERLHELDRQGLDVIYVALPPDTPEWAAIRDRLIRAAAGT